MRLKDNPGLARKAPAPIEPKPDASPYHDEIFEADYGGAPPPEPAAASSGACAGPFSSSSSVGVETPAMSAAIEETLVALEERMRVIHAAL